jgi:hypothetical protein
MAHDDDLDMWDDDPLVRALRAPASSSELAGEDEALAAFRAAVPRRSKRRLARRMGTGAGTLAVAVALSGGVAAAYTHTLPGPVQRVAHSWFGEIGVGAPTAGHVGAKHPSRSHGARGSGAPVTPLSRRTTTPSPPSAGPNPAVGPSARSKPVAAVTPRPADQPSHRGRATAPYPPTPVASPNPSPTASTPPRQHLVPADVSGTVSAQRVPAGTGVTLSGRLTTSSGAAVPGRRIVAQSRPAGGHQRWSPVATARTDSAGDVSFSLPALSRTTRLRLKARHRVHSAVSTVVVVPTLEASTTRNGTSYDVSITSAGLQPGDTLVVVRRQRGHRMVVARLSVDGSGSVGFTVPAPRRRDRRYRVITRRTHAHAGATTTFVASRP